MTRISDPGLRRAIAVAGSKYRLAQLLKITPQSVQTWRRVPVGHVLELERLLGIPRAQLRPELYR